MKFGLRWALPLVQVLLAVGLLVMAHGQQRKELGADSSWFKSAWDYSPPARDAAYVINFPALVISRPVAALLRMDPPWGDVPFLAAIALLWYWIGAGLDRRLGLLAPAGPPGLFLRVVYCIAFLGAISLVAVLIWTKLAGSTGLGLRVVVPSVAWSVGLAIYFGKRVLGSPPVIPRPLS